MTKLILLSAYLLIFPQSGEVSGEMELLEQSRSQAELYIQNIRREANVPENFWALSALWDSNSETKGYISGYLDGNPPDEPLLQAFRDTSSTYGDLVREAAFRLDSPRLLTAYLLDEEDSLRRREALEAFNFQEKPSGTRYRSLLDSLVSGGSISEEILPVDDLGLTHFLLFYYSAGRSVMPENYMSRVAEIPVRGNGSTPSLPSILRWLTIFQAQYNTNQYSKALDYYSLLSEDELLPNSKFKFNIYRFLDYAMYQLGYSDRSLEIVRNFTLPLSHYLERRSLQLTINLTRAIYLYDIGKIKEAQSAYQEVLEEAERRQILSSYLSVLFNNLAVTYLNTGDYDQYFNLQFRALEIADSTGNYENQFAILQNLFVAYRNNRNAESAMTYLGRARELALNEGKREDLAEIDLYTGTFYENIEGNYEKAQEFFSKADENISLEDNYTLYQELKFEQAELYYKQGMYEKSLDLYSHITDIATEHNNQQNVIESQIKRARVHLLSNNRETAGEAIDYYSQQDLNPLRFDQLVEARTVEATYHKETGNREKSLAILTPLIEQIVEWARGSTDLQTGFWNVESEYLEAFRLAATLLIDMGRNKEAVQVLDQLKSINDARLYQNPLVRSSILSESELSQYKRLSDQLNSLRRQHLAASGERRAELQRRIDELSARKSTFDRMLSSESALANISVDHVQSRLDAHERVLHITELDNRYYIATISRTDVNFREVPLDSTNRSLIEKSVKQVADGNTNLDNLYRISRLLGFDNLEKGIKRLTVIPDSYLYQLPLDVLPVASPEFTYSYGGTEYLIEQVELRYLTSLNDYRERGGGERPHTMDFAGYGISTFEDYSQSGLVSLPYARREVSNINSVLSNAKSKNSYFDAQSSEAVFKSTAPSARIIHLATHSQVSEQDPLFSRIYMSGEGESGSGEQFPGQIFAYELFELNLSSELVMLNSCESGSGGYLQGSGIMGFSRALRYAGANTLVLNLWSVNDMMASEFAVKFYESINAGKSKSEALRSAKLHFLRQKNASPHYWGPYMLIGDTEPAVRPYETWNLLMAGSFMLYFLLFVGGSLAYRYRGGGKAG